MLRPTVSIAARAAKPSLITALLCTALLVSAWQPATASAQAQAQGDEATDGEEGRARIFEGTLAFGMMGQHIRTRTDQRQSYYGPTLEVVGFLGPRWGFLADMALFFPMRGREVGSSGNVRRTYDRNLGFDIVLGVGKQLELAEGLTITAGPGVHFNALDLNDPDLIRINSITMGVGGVGSLLWTYHNALVVGATGKFGMDFIDLIHDTGKLSVGFVWSVGVSAGLQFD